jgi:hypothetical protein
MKMTGVEKKAAKQAAQATKQEEKKSETAPVIPEEGCTKTTVEAIFRAAFWQGHPKLFRVSDD